MMRREDVPLLDWLGYKVRAVRLPFELAPRSRAQWIQPMDGEPWDLLAYTHYGDEELWYILADVNGVDDPFRPLKATERLAVPELY